LFGMALVNAWQKYFKGVANVFNHDHDATS
jgi:hypothetical protein